MGSEELNTTRLNEDRNKLEEKMNTIYVKIGEIKDINKIYNCSSQGIPCYWIHENNKWEMYTYVNNSVYINGQLNENDTFRHYIPLYKGFILDGQYYPPYREIK